MDCRTYAVALQKVARFVLTAPAATIMLGPTEDAVSACYTNSVGPAVGHVVPGEGSAPRYSLLDLLMVREVSGLAEMRSRRPKSFVYYSALCDHIALPKSYRLGPSVVAENEIEVPMHLSPADFLICQTAFEASPSRMLGIRRRIRQIIFR